MIHRHFEELDDAVRTRARPSPPSAWTTPTGLSACCTTRWYLGLTSQQAAVPEPAPPETRTWQAWGRLWTDDLHGPGTRTRSGCT